MIETQLPLGERYVPNDVLLDTEKQQSGIVGWLPVVVNFRFPIEDTLASRDCLAAIHRNIIVELRLLHGSDAQSLPIHLPS